MFGYFNFSAPWIRIKKFTLAIKLWTVFFNPNIQWGFGLIQINFWHFIYIGSDGFMFCDDMRTSKTYTMK